MDELESLVSLYKRQTKMVDEKAKLIEKLEDLELEDHDDFVYFKRVKNS